MSHHYVAVTDIPAGGEQLKTDKIASIQSLCLMIGGIGAVISAILLLPQLPFFSPSAQDSLGRSYAFSWLFGFEVFFTITVGMLFWVLLHNASNSGWGVAIRRIPETISNNFGLMFILGLPLIFIPSIRETVWTWIGHHAVARTVDAGPDATLYDQIHAGGHATHLLAHKFGYLHLGWGSIPGFDMRYVIYFAILGFGAWKMRQYSLSQDTSGSVKTTFTARRFAAGWLPLMAIASSFASIDWIEGLDYKWFSTMWPVNVFAGSAMSSMALIILVVGLLVKTGHLNHIVSVEHFHIKGKLMHAFIIFWAYICFSQYFLIWYANIPEETRFFAIRNTGGYWYLSLALTFLHFVVPFVALLKRDAKKNLNAIMIIAAYVIFIHVLEVFWWVTPQRGPVLYDASSAPTFGRLILDFGMDLMALATIGGLYGYCFLKRLAKASIYPCGDPRLEESVNLMN